MWALIKGLLTVLKHLFIRPITLEYPEKKRFQSDAFRGKPEVNLDANGCVGCGICKKVCPSGAIEYNKNEEGKVVSYTFNLEKCIFCGNCRFYCPHNAINMAQNFELATPDKKELQLTYTREQGGADD